MTTKELAEELIGLAADGHIRQGGIVAIAQKYLDAEAQVAALTARLDAYRDAADPFIRVYSLNQPLNIEDGSPLKRVIPGVWPKFGDLRKLAEVAALPAPDGGRG